MRVAQHTRLARSMEASQSWPFSREITGNTVIRNTTNGVDDLAYSSSGVPNYSYQFRDNIPGVLFSTSNSDYASGTERPAYTITSTGLTVSFWWKPTSAYPGANGWLIVCKYGAAVYEWQMFVNNTGQLAVQVFNTIAGLLTQNNATLGTLDGHWHHVVVDFPGTATTSYPVVYWDAHVCTASNTAGSGSYAGDTTAAWTIGQRSATLANYYFPGGIRHLKVVPRSLGHAKVNRLYREELRGHYVAA